MSRSDTSPTHRPAILGRTIWLLLWVGCLFTAVLGLDTGRLAAQSSLEPWSEPLNISGSGGATDPRLAVSADGTVHLLWLEAVAQSFFYSSRTGDGWTPAVPLSVPFAITNTSGGTTLYPPELVATENGRLHAFWIDDEGDLFYSRVIAAELVAPGIWTNPERLGTGVIDFAATVTLENELTLAFIQRADETDQPAGVYTRRLDENGQWSGPAAVYNSPYYRSQVTGDSRIALVAGPILITPTVTLDDSTEETVSPTAAITPPAPVMTDGVALLWENALLERIFLSRSSSRQIDWESPTLIDRRKTGDLEQAIGPNRPAVIYWGGELHLFWMAGHETVCSLLHQRSADGAQMWTGEQSVTALSQGCPDKIELTAGHEDYLILQTTFGDNLFFQAWDGMMWSDPQIQPELTGFQDDETVRPVTLNCRQTVFGEAGGLIAAGCGESGDKMDIWVLERSLEDVPGWYPEREEAVWTSPVPLVRAGEVLLTPIILTDEAGRFHAFWLANPAAEDLDGQARIFYSLHDGEEWSRAVPLQTLNTNRADQLSGTIGQGGIFFLMWRDADSNTFLFSAVDGDKIQSPSDWSSPQPVPVLEGLVTSPSLFVEPDGAIYIAFAVPLNDQRGIYLVRTGDGGRTWAGPLMVADAAANGSAMVDRPQLTQTADGQLHAIWTTYDLRPDPVPEALMYARSADNGITWTEPVVIREGMLTWSRIAGSGSDNVLIVWKQETADQAQILAQKSLDSGIAWSPVEAVLSSEASHPVPVLTGQGFEQLHILQLAPGLGSRPTLQIRAWLNNEWQEVQTDPVPIAGEEAIPSAISAGLVPAGGLALLVLTIENQEENSDRSTQAAWAFNRLEKLNLISAPVPEIDSTATPAAEEAEAESAEATPLPAPTETPVEPEPSPTFTPEAIAEVETEAADPPLVDIAPPADSPSSVTVFTNALVPVVAFIGLFLAGLFVYRRRR